MRADIQVTSCMTKVTCIMHSMQVVSVTEICDNNL